MTEYTEITEIEDRYSETEEENYTKMYGMSAFWKSGISGRHQLHDSIINVSFSDLYAAKIGGITVDTVKNTLLNVGIINEEDQKLLDEGNQKHWITVTERFVDLLITYIVASRHPMAVFDVSDFRDYFGEYKQINNSVFKIIKDSDNGRYYITAIDDDSIKYMLDSAHHFGKTEGDENQIQYLIGVIKWFIALTMTSTMVNNHCYYNDDEYMEDLLSGSSVISVRYDNLLDMIESDKQTVKRSIHETDEQPLDVIENRLHVINSFSNLDFMIHDIIDLVRGVIDIDDFDEDENTDDEIDDNDDVSFNPIDDTMKFASQLKEYENEDNISFTSDPFDMGVVDSIDEISDEALEQSINNTSVPNSTSNDETTDDIFVNVFRKQN